MGKNETKRFTAEDTTKGGAEVVSTTRHNVTTECRTYNDGISITSIDRASPVNADWFRYTHTRGTVVRNPRRRRHHRCERRSASGERPAASWHIIYSACTTHEQAQKVSAYAGTASLARSTARRYVAPYHAPHYCPPQGAATYASHTVRRDRSSNRRFRRLAPV